MNISEVDLMFKCPFTMTVAGPSGSGKTVLVRNILKNHKVMFNPTLPSLKVLWAYGQWQSTYREKLLNTDVIYYDGLPSQDELLGHSANVLVIDDLMNEVADNPKLGSLFTKGSHHLNINVIFITQNLYHQGKQMRNVNLSCHYLIIMKNPRDRSQIDVLAKQMKLKKALVEAYNDATSKPYGYLLIDLKQDTPQDLMLRSRITPDEGIKGQLSPIIYIPK